MQKGNMKKKVDKWHYQQDGDWITKTLQVVGLNKVSHSEMEMKEIPIHHMFPLSVFRLLCTNLLLSPSGKTTIALDGETIAAVSAAEATDTRA